MSGSHIQVQGLNPWPFLALQLTTSIIVLGFTAPSSILRPAILPLLAICCYIACLNLQQFTWRTPWAAAIVCFAAIFVLQYLEMAMISRWSFEAQGPSSFSSKARTGSKRIVKESNARKDTIWNRLRFGATSIISFRDLDTDHETQNTPRFSATDPSFTPSRTRFLVTTLPKIVLCYLILDIIESQPPPPDAKILFSPSKVPLIQRFLSEGISIEEVLVRMGSSVGFWIVMYCFINAMSLLLGLLCVGSGVSEVREWRPIMGSICEAYTIRGFWGKFWHQGTRKTFNYPTRYLIDHFPFPLPTLVARYAKIFLTFYVSGIVHVMGDWVGFMPWSESGSLKFFMAQALGIVFEDLVQWSWKKIFGDGNGKGGKSGGRTWKRMVGFMWVGVFLLFWSTPAWVFPSASRNTGAPESKLLPFSVVGRIGLGQ